MAVAGVGIGVVSAGVGALALFVEVVMCGNHVVATVSSPDRSHTAVVFERNCGSTTGFSTQITLNSLFGGRAIGAGNLWVADTDHGTAPSAHWGGPEVRLEWESATTLKVVHHPDARIFRAETNVSGVTVRYETNADPSNKPLHLTAASRRR